MNGVDLIVLGLLIWAAYRGYKKGLLLEVVGILAFGLGILLSLKLLQWGQDLLTEHFQLDESLLPYIAFFILFALIVIGVNLLGTGIKKALHLSFLGTVDSLLGAALGIFKWALGISVIFWALKAMGVDDPGGTLADSYLFNLLQPLAPGFFELVGQAMPKAKEFFRGKEI